MILRIGPSTFIYGTLFALAGCASAAESATCYADRTLQSCIKQVQALVSHIEQGSAPEGRGFRSSIISVSPAPISDEKAFLSAIKRCQLDKLGNVSSNDVAGRRIYMNWSCKGEQFSPGQEWQSTCERNFCEKYVSVNLWPVESGFNIGFEVNFHVKPRPISVKAIPSGSDSKSEPAK